MRRSYCASTKKLDKKKRLLKKLAADQKKLQKLRAKGELGEILKANIYRVSRGMSELQTNDWHGEQVTIPLDPALKPQDNLEKLFRLSKKGVRGLPLVSERLRVVSEEIQGLERRLAHIKNATADELGQVSVSNGSGRLRATSQNQETMD